MVIFFSLSPYFYLSNSEAFRKYVLPKIDSKRFSYLDPEQLEMWDESYMEGTYDICGLVMGLMW